MPSAPKVSVLVISFNRSDDLRLCLEALRSTRYPALEIVVLDNASSDDSAQVARSFEGASGGLAEVKVIESAENLGFAEGNNRALAIATGDYVALVNNDCVVAADWITSLVGFLEVHPEAAAAGGKAYFWGDGSPVGSVDNRYYSYTIVEPETCSSQAHLDTPDEVREVATLSGCAVMIRRAAIEAVGGELFEPLFFTYYEETDFFARLLRKGHRIYYTGGPSVWHRVRASTASQPYRYYYYMERNRLLLAYRNLDDESLGALVKQTARRALDEALGHPLGFVAGRDDELRARRDAYAWLVKNRATLRAFRPLAAGEKSYVEAVGDAQMRGRYYLNARPEVAELVPASARVIVDVGCGGGALGRFLKATRPGVSVRGIEPEEAPASRAREVLDDVMIGTAEDPTPGHWPEPDCVIFADVLEHTVDPWSVLRTWRKRVRPGGTIVVSIPNVLHHSVLLPSLLGRWRYEEAGVLDRTHLRFFTRQSAIELLEQAGFKVSSVRRLIDVPPSTLVNRLALWLSRRFVAREQGARAPLAPHDIRRVAADLVTVQLLLVGS